MTQTLEQTVTPSTVPGDPAAMAAEALPVPGREIVAAQVAAIETASVGAAALIGEIGVPEGRFAQLSSTVREVVTHPQVRAGAMGAARLALNTVITAADTVPGVGDVVSWAADAGKFTGRHSPFNLTPDVPHWVAIASEELESVTGGLAPTHAIETLLQLRSDIPRMRAGWRAAYGVLTGHRTPLMQTLN